MATQANPNKSTHWLLPYVCLIPFALLFIAFAAGTAIPLRLFMVVLAWCLLMPLWMRAAGAPERADEHRAFRRETAGDEREVLTLRSLSAQADYREMLDWLAEGKLAPRRVFVTHSEPSAFDAFRRRRRDTFDWNAVVPDDGSTWELE
jgi:hypothetical protein